MKWPLTSIAGIAAILLYNLFTLAAIALFPAPFTATKYWTADLGRSALNPCGALIYNAGHTLMGLALFPFFAGFNKYYTNERWRKILLIIGQIAGGLTALASTMEGIYSADYPTEHMFWTIIFFISSLAALILLNTSLITHPKFIRPIGYYGYAVVALNLAVAATGFTPLSEWLMGVVAIQAYIALIAYNAFRL